MLKLIQVGGAVGLLGVAYVGMTIDKAVNYQEVSARVARIDETCFLEKKEGKKTRYTDTMDCRLAEALRQAHPAYDGFKVVRDVKLQLAYNHPATGQYTRATLELSRYGSYPDLQVGGVVQVLAHKEEPGKVREL